MAKQCTVSVAIKKMAAAADMEAVDTINGEVLVRAGGSKALVGRFRNEAEAKAGIANFISQNMQDLDAGFAIPTAGGTPLHATALPNQSQLTPTRKKLAAFQYGVTIGSPIDRFAEAAETLMKGPAYTKIVKP